VPNYIFARIETKAVPDRSPVCSMDNTVV